MEAVRAILISYACVQSVAALSIVGHAVYRMYQRITANEDVESKPQTLLKLFRMLMIQMGAIYGNVFLHIFDFMTDALVISQWFTTDAHHIDDLLIAWLAVSFLILYRLASPFAVYITSDFTDWKEGLMQFFDVLFLFDLYQTHQKIIGEFNAELDVASASSSAIGKILHNKTVHKKNKFLHFAVPLNVLLVNHGGGCHHHKQNERITNIQKQKQQQQGKDTPALIFDLQPQRVFLVVIDKARQSHVNLDLLFKTTLRFRFIRSLEGLYEASVQAVFQLVYVMRAGRAGHPLFLVSIIFSIISSVMAAVSRDNVYIAEAEWIVQSENWKKLLINQIRRFLFRFLEIIARVGCLAIFWTVVGGFWFTFLIIGELSVPLYYNFQHYLHDDEFFSNRDFYLAINTIIALPIEWVFEASNITDPYDDVFQKHCKCCSCSLQCTVLAFPAVVLFIVFQGLRWLVCHPFGNNDYFKYASLRLFVTYLEWGIIILNFVLFEDKTTTYLTSTKHCFVLTIISGVFLCIFTMVYPYLMIDLRLPNNLPANSKLAYAYLGNISQLSKLYLENITLVRFCDEHFQERMRKIDSSSGGSNYYNHEKVRRTVRKQKLITEDAHKLLLKVFTKLEIQNDLPVQQRIYNPLKILRLDAGQQLIENPIAIEALDDLIDEIPQKISKYWHKCIKYVKKNDKNTQQEEVIRWLTERGATNRHRMSIF